MLMYDKQLKQFAPTTTPSYRGSWACASSIGYRHPQIEDNAPFFLEGGSLP